MVLEGVEVALSAANECRLVKFMLVLILNLEGRMDSIVIGF